MTFPELKTKGAELYAKLGGPRSRDAQVVRAMLEQIVRHREQIATMGDRHNECTFPELGTVCESCRCARRFTPRNPPA